MFLINSAAKTCTAIPPPTSHMIQMCSDSGNHDRLAILCLLKLQYFGNCFLLGLI